MRELHELSEEVEDEETFLTFVCALCEDRRQSQKIEKINPSSPYGPESGGWENTSIDAFLEAAIAWAEDSSFGTRMAFPEYELDGKNPWRSFAAFLMAGKIYE